MESIYSTCLFTILVSQFIIGFSASQVQGLGKTYRNPFFNAAYSNQSMVEDEVDLGCTTFLAAGNATHDGSIILAKNRDLDEFEAQWLYYSPRQYHPPGSRVQLQYIEIPQTEVTWAWVGFKSYTLKWGVGMGINEWGVAVADNDAPTREPLAEQRGLHDNDVCRLILERAETAYEGMRIAGVLLEQYGHSYVGQVYWVADAKECWILEGAGRHWAAVKVVNGFEVRANQFQITTFWDAASPDLVEYTVRQGWCTSADDFSFAECYSGAGYPYQSSQTRYTRVQQLLGAKAGNITLGDMMLILADHYEDTVMYHQPPHDNKEYRTVCCRQTVAAMVAHLRPWQPRQLQLMWCCMSNPCISVFTPVYASTSAILKPYLTGTGARDMSGYNPESAWWRFKRLQTLVDKGYSWRLPAVRERWANLYAEERSGTAELEQHVLGLIDEERFEDAEDAVNAFVNTWLSRAYTVCGELTEALTQNPPPWGENWTPYLLIGAALIVLFTAVLYLKKKRTRASSRFQPDRSLMYS